MYFRTKDENFASPFRKLRLPQHDADAGRSKCFVAIVEEDNEKRCWDRIFVCCPDYKALETGQVRQVKDPECPSRMIDETLEMIAKRV